MVLFLEYEKPRQKRTEAIERLDGSYLRKMGIKGRNCGEQSMDPTAYSVNRDDLITRGMILNPSSSRLFIRKTPVGKQQTFLSMSSPIKTSSCKHHCRVYSPSQPQFRSLFHWSWESPDREVWQVPVRKERVILQNHRWLFLKTTARASWSRKRCIRCLSRSSASRARWNGRLCPTAMNSLVRTTIAVHLHGYSTGAWSVFGRQR